MKVLKTIVATAVIVFALTTVAAAGARHLRADDHPGAAATGTAAPAAGQVAGVTLTEAQFARLLRAAGARTSTGARSATRSAHQATTHTSRAVRRDAQKTATGSGNHATHRQHTQAHVTGDATHAGGGTHDSDGDGTHDGDPHDGGTHDGGTHDGGGHHE